MIGIYKITSPSKRVYIGQSIDIKRRFVTYRKSKGNNQPKLNRSFLKYGVDNHIFDVLEECELYELNDKERYYQDLYCVLDSKGLNCNLTKSSDRSGRHSEETKIKISTANKGKKLSEETKLKLSISRKNMSNETRAKIGLFHKGRKRSEETRNKIAIRSKNPSIETRLKMSISSTGKKQSSETVQKRVNSIKENAGKIILDTSCGVFYIGIKQAVPIYGIKYIKLAKMLSGHRKNKTNLIYV